MTHAPTSVVNSNSTQGAAPASKRPARDAGARIYSISSQSESVFSAQIRVPVGRVSSQTSLPMRLG
jgi:hypothetical protein